MVAVCHVRAVLTVLLASTSPSSTSASASSPAPASFVSVRVRRNDVIFTQPHGVIVSNEDDKLHKETYDNNNNNNNFGSVASRPKCCVLNQTKQNNNQLTRVETQGSASAKQKQLFVQRKNPNLNDTS